MVRSGWIASPLLAALALGGCSTGELVDGGDASATDPESVNSATTDASTGDTDGGMSTAATSGSESASASDSDSGPTSESSTTGTTSGGTTDDPPFQCEGGVPSGDKCCYPPAEAGVVSPPVTLTFELTVNGQPLNQGDSDDGDLFLVDPATGDRIHIGKSTFGALKAHVFPGAYDLVYESESRGPLLPWNRSTIVLAGIQAASDETITHDIHVVAAKSAITINNNTPPSALSDDGDIFLIDPKSGGRTHVARTSLLDAGTFTANLVPGTYEVRYAAHARKSVMPYNTETAIGTFVVDDKVSPGEAPLVIEAAPITMSTLMLDGDLFFNGAVPPDSDYDHGRLYLRDAATYSITLIADTIYGRIDEIPILNTESAVYDLIYAGVAHKSAAPVNEWASVHEAMSASEIQAEAKALSLTTVTLGGTMTIDGALPAFDANNRGELLLGRDGDRARIGGSTGALSGVVLAATYDAFFRHELSDGGLPMNTRGRVQASALNLEKDDDLTLSIATATISGAFTVGGAAPSTSPYESGRILLRSDEGDAVYLGLTRDQVFSRRLIQGHYTVSYAVESSKGSVPQNHDVAIGELDVDGDLVDVTIDVPVIEAAFDNPIPQTPGSGVGRIYLRHRDTGDEIFVGTSAAAAFLVTLVPGNYDLVYRLDVLGDNVAWNNGAVFDCYTLGEVP